MNKEFKDHKVINDEKMKQNWEIKKIKDICDKASSNIVQNKITELDGDYPIFGASGFVQNVDFYHRDTEYIGIVKDGSGVGRVNTYPAYSSLLGTLQYIIPKKGYLINYVSYALKSLKLSEYASGAAIPHIYFKDYGEAVIPVPPLPIQEKIVAELDCLRGVIEKKKEQLKELDALAQSIFYTMFGDPITNEKGWEVKKLGDSVIEMFLGPFGSALKTDCYVDKNKSYCMIYEQKHAIKKTMELETKYIDKDKFESLKRFEVHSGDFIMSCRGTIGEIFRLPNDAPIGIIHPSLMKIRINENVYHPLFFIRLLSIIVKNANTNGNCVQMAITAKELGTKKPILPPLTLQQEFAAKVEAIEKQKGLIKESIKEVEDLFNARMQYYFG